MCKFSVVIPTLDRVSLLENLLRDILSQNLLPHEIVVVDGNPSTKLVLNSIQEFLFLKKVLVKYVPSSRPNAPFQRCLGAYIAEGSDVIVFVDDDISFPNDRVFEKILLPFQWVDRFVVGVTPLIKFPAFTQTKKHPNFGFLSKAFRIQPGDITPVGDRIPPGNCDQDYVITSWLRGGVMAFRSDSLLRVIYDEDTFALSEIGCGLGADDTILSRRVGISGSLVLACCIQVLHPNKDKSKVRPSNIFKLGYANAYSRRFINDHFRVRTPPNVFDRTYLFLYLFSNSFKNFVNAFRDTENLNYALGYLSGTIDALMKPPLSKNLSPSVNWRKEFEFSLARAIQIK